MLALNILSGDFSNNYNINAINLHTVSTIKISVLCINFYTNESTWIKQIAYHSTTISQQIMRKVCPIINISKLNIFEFAHIAGPKLAWKVAIGSVSTKQVNLCWILTNKNIMDMLKHWDKLKQSDMASGDSYVGPNFLRIEA